MAIRLVFGRSGSGKTWNCLEQIKQALTGRRDQYAGHDSSVADHCDGLCDGPLIYVVPEQYTLEAERSLIEHAGVETLTNAAILSFKRLAHKVLRDIGDHSGKYINSAGKKMCLMMVLEELKPQLRYFTRRLEQKGFIDELAALFTEFKRFEWNWQRAAEKLNRVEDRLFQVKMSELSLLYDAYCKRINRDYLDTEDDLTRLSQCIPQSDYLKDARIWVDGFSGFTVQEIHVLSVLARCVRELTINLCCDCIPDNRSKISDLDLFSPVKKTVLELMEAFERNHCDLGAVEKTLLTGDGVSGDAARSIAGDAAGSANAHALNYLERNLYRSRVKPFLQHTDAIHTVSCGNYFDEVEFVAGDILKTCRERGYRFNDIAVICPELESYAELIQPIFAQYRIDCFLDSKRDITDYPLVNLILSLLTMLDEDFHYDAVFSYLKTYLTSIEPEEIDALENYVLAHGIRGRVWKSEKPWRFRSGSDYDDPVNPDRRMDGIRRRVLAPIMEFLAVVSEKGGCGAVEFSTALYEFLKNCGAKENLELKIREYDRYGSRMKASELRQIWAFVMEVLDQICELEAQSLTTASSDNRGQGRRLLLSEYRNLFTCGIENYRVGVIPPSVDGVLVGSPERTRSHPVKLLYIMGVNEGAFPRTQPSVGLLNDIERIELNEIGVSIGKDSTTVAFEGPFSVYSALTIPSEQLKLTWIQSDMSGKVVRPSAVIAALDRLFPLHVRMSYGPELGELYFELRTETIDGALNGLIGEVRKLADLKSARKGEDTGGITVRLSPQWQAVQRVLEEVANSQERFSAVCGSLLYRDPTVILPVELVEKLSARQLAPRQEELPQQDDSASAEATFLSVSRIERYAACPFAYFVRYLLNAEDREVYRLEAPDIGSFVHSAIERTAKSISGAIRSDADMADGMWKQPDRELFMEYTSRVVEQMLCDNVDNVFLSSRRNRFLADRIKKMVGWSVFSMAKQIAAGEYEPWDFEVPFSNDTDLIVLENGRSVKLHGQIDRVDVAFGKGADEGESDTNYVRVIDFKTGRRKLSLNDIYQGLAFQLPVYLEEALKIVGSKMSGGRAAVGAEDGAPACIPGGMFYFTIERPILNIQKEKKARADWTDIDTEEKLLGKMHMNGMVIGDEDSYRKTAEREPEKTSKVVKGIRFKKDGSFYSNTLVPSTDDFSLICRVVRRNIRDHCQNLFGGDFSVRPYKKKDSTSCDYCEYRGVCRVDLCQTTTAFREIDQKSDRVVLEQIRTGSEDV